MNSPNEFDEAYYEHGLETGKSLYSNYHWMPERSLVEAHAFVQAMKVTRSDLVVDYGCAKGYFVKALRLLGYKAIGFDISLYAILHADPDVQHHVTSSLETLRSWMKCSPEPRIIGMCKDVLEHCADDSVLITTLRTMRDVTREWMVVVPAACAHCGNYIIPEYESDTTHHIRYDVEEWTNMMSSIFGGPANVRLSSYLLGIKNKWAEKYRNRQGDLFFITQK